MQQLFCPWDSAQFLIFSENVPQLLFYSHIPAMLLALLIGFVVLKQTKGSRMGSALFIVTLLFFFWNLFDLVLWATNDPSTVMFFWSLQVIFEPLIYVISFYVTYLFITKGHMPFWLKLFTVLLYIPLLFSAPSSGMLAGVNISDCTAVENFFAQYYTYIVEATSVVLIIISSVIQIKVLKDVKDKKESSLFTYGVLLFLLVFSLGNIIGSFSDNWVLAQVGLVSMPIFFGFLAYMVVRFKTFNMKVFGAQILILATAIVVGSQFFFIKVKTNIILNAITLFLVVIFGYFLIRSVKKEVKQREELQILTDQLFEANEKLKGLDKLKSEFLSLASHQIRSPLTAIKGYSSMVVAGDFGPIGDKAKEAVNRIFKSSQSLTLMVEDFLNVSKIEQGGMKYEKANFDFAQVAKTMAGDLSVTAEGKGLKLTYTQDEGNHMVFGDKEKIRQVVLNFIDNSIKYTKEGSVEVSVVNKSGKIILAVKDTGMGLSPETKAQLFQKFSRGEGGKVNTTGSGLGLYLAKEIISAHDGKVGVESPGPGLGSTFFVELNEAK